VENARAIGLPRLGIYSDGMREIFEKLGVRVVMPPRITRDIVKAGVMNSSDMICYPFKVTLGQEIYNLEHGATDLLMAGSYGQCRFKHYHQLQAHILSKLGYKFTMHNIKGLDFLWKLPKITGVSLPGILLAMMAALPLIKEAEHKEYDHAYSNPIKIAIVGEFYTMIEPDVNFDIVRKLQGMGVAVDVSLRLSNFIKKWFRLDFFDKRAEKKEAKHLLGDTIGGHGYHTIYNSIYYGKQGFDGLIHLLPLSCMPESTVEPLVDYVAEKYNIPLYRFPLDESSFEVGFSTRLETFVSMLKRRKEKGIS